MSKLIIVCGLGGTGKTILAKALSRKLNIYCLHKDTIKEGLHEKLNFYTQDTYKLYFYLAEEQIKNNVDLIMESPFNFENDIKLVTKWQKKYKIKLTCIICNIDIDTRKKRIIKRDRHECHKEDDIKMIKNIFNENIDYSKLPGNHIEITTNKPVEKLIKNIIKQLK